MKFHSLLAANALCILLSTVFASVSEAALVNAGFETGDYSGWTVGGNARNGVAADGESITGTYYLDNVVNVHSGNFAAWGAVSSYSSPQKYLTLSQTVNVSPGASYDVGFWLSIGSSNSYQSAGRNYSISVDGVTVLRVYQDGFAGTDYWAGSDPTNYLHEHALYTASSGQTLATVTYWLSGSGTAEVGFSYDDFHFSAADVAVVPVPAAAWLLGSGMVGLMGIARRRKAT